MTNFLRNLFFFCLVRPLVILILGINLRHKERLPANGPAIVVANHNSHLDILVLMTLFPIFRLKKLRPVAAADYFLKNKWLAWFSQKIIGIIPIERNSTKFRRDPFANIQQALDEEAIVILFPEGSRGKPEEMTALKRGIAHLAKQNSDVAAYPIFMHGLGKALPKNEALLVPFIIDVFVGNPLHWQGDKDQYMQNLQTNFETLKNETVIQDWP